jgi:hypothetical protein
MAIDDKTYNEISNKLVSAIDQIWKERNAEDIGPVIAAAFCRMGASMFFYCSENKSVAAVATLEATAAGIEEAMQHETKDMLQAASNTLQ